MKKAGHGTVAGSRWVLGAFEVLSRLRPSLAHSVKLVSGEPGGIASRRWIFICRSDARWETHKWSGAQLRTAPHVEGPARRATTGARTARGASSAGGQDT